MAVSFPLLLALFRLLFLLLFFLGSSNGHWLLRFVDHLYFLLIFNHHDLHSLLLNLFFHFLLNLLLNFFLNLRFNLLLWNFNGNFGHFPDVSLHVDFDVLLSLKDGLHDLHILIAEECDIVIILIEEGEFERGRVDAVLLYHKGHDAVVVDGLGEELDVLVVFKN